MKFQIQVKTSDSFFACLLSEKGKGVAAAEGYPIKGIGIDDGFGDGICVTIDTETGKVEGFPTGADFLARWNEWTGNPDRCRTFDLQIPDAQS